MGLFIADRSRREGPVSLSQLAAGLVAFIAVSVMGGFIIAGLFLPLATITGSATKAGFEAFDDLPSELTDVTLPQQSNIYASDGETLLATFFAQNRVVVPLEDISPWIQKAVVATEDKRFWLHHGVDGEGLMRAVYVNLTSEDSPGASTLTQQVVKNTLLEAASARGDRIAVKSATEVSLARKAREARMALGLEQNLDERYGTECEKTPAVDCGKEQILEQYLNIAQFGKSVYGVESAAQFYFSKPAKNLTAIEAATIAGITQNPSKWNPQRDPEAAELRRNVVLSLMRDQEMITPEEYEEYSSTPIEETLRYNYPKFSCLASEEAPFFCDYVTKVISLHEVFGGEGYDLLLRGGLTIVTTLDYEMQEIANFEIRETLPVDDESGLAMALVSLDPATGNILAMAQNRDFDPAATQPGSTAINYSTDREYGGSRGFSPGSTFKPVILAEWLNTGHSLSQVVSGDKRPWDKQTFRVCDGYYADPGTWQPGNVGSTGARQQTVFSATANSVNTAYVAMAHQLNLCGIRDMAKTLGFERADGAEFEVNPTITLGTQNASPLTMAEITATFANRGIHCEPRAILSIVDSQGNEIDVPPIECTQAITSEVADGVTDALTRVMTEGSGKGARLTDRPSAGKTGTSQSNTHTWFTGFTPQLVTTVWMGHPDIDTKMQFIEINDVPYDYVYGSTLCAPTWRNYMNRVLEGAEVLQLPTASDAMINGVPLEVPLVVGLQQKAAEWDANDAGFNVVTSEIRVYSPGSAEGSVAKQSPEAGARMAPGSTVTLFLSIQSLPGWWTDWPVDWDPNVAPADYWGSTWPAPEWVIPQGWYEAQQIFHPTEPTPAPEPTPDPGKEPKDGG